jgi:predicted DsbA family dithiol-disulfide isomerase
LRLDIWSDVLYPWSYIGKRRFDRAWAGFRHRTEVVVVHHSFLLEPVVPFGDHTGSDAPVDSWLGAPVGVLKSRMISVEHAGAVEGLELHLVAAMTGDTLAAHRLLHLARRRDLQWPLLERFFRAHFTEQRSLLEHRSLVRLAAEVGLDGTEAAAVLAGNEYTDAVQADVQAARALGVSSTPFFLIDGYHRIAGAQPTEAFAYALDRVWADTHRVRPAQCRRARARSLGQYR